MVASKWCSQKDLNFQRVGFGPTVDANFTMRAYNIMKLYQGAFYHPKRCCCACLYNGSPCRVRTYDSAVKARGVPNYTNGLQDETHSNYRSYDLYQERPLPANRVFGVYLALSGSATSVPVCFSIG